MSALDSDVKLFKQSDVDLSARLTVAQILLTLLIIILITIAQKASFALAVRNQYLGVKIPGDLNTDDGQKMGGQKAT